MFRIMILAAWIGSCFCSAALAQAPNETVKPVDLKKQIEELQSQLRKLEINDQRNNRVTEIGSRFQARETAMIVRLYDLNDLFASAPSYEAHHFDNFQLGESLLFSAASHGNQGRAPSEGIGGMGGGMFGVPDPLHAVPSPEKHIAASFGGAGPNQGGKTGAPQSMSDARTSMHTLIEAITSTIAPTTWEEVGGPGSIARIGNSLLISTELGIHEQIESLLGQFRQRWKTLRTVTVRAYWLWLTDEQLTALVAEQVDDAIPYGVVDDKAWRNRPMADPKLGAGYRAMLTCYNGQTVHVAAGGERLSVADMNAEKTEPVDEKHAGTIVYRPKLVSLQDGAALQVRPIVSNSGKFIAIDLHSRVARLITAQGAKAEIKRPDSLQDVVESIDRPEVVVQRLSTTLRVPVNRVMLVGGMTFSGTTPPNDATLCLFVRATVQDLSDDLPSATAKGTPAEAAK